MNKNVRVEHQVMLREKCPAKRTKEESLKRKGTLASNRVPRVRACPHSKLWAEC